MDKGGIIMFGQKPHIDLHPQAHPITQKIWMKKHYAKDDKVFAEVFEDGYVIFFNKDEFRVGIRNYSSQRVAVEDLRMDGYRIE